MEHNAFMEIDRHRAKNMIIYSYHWPLYWHLRIHMTTHKMHSNHKSTPAYVYLSEILICLTHPFTIVRLYQWRVYIHMVVCPWNVTGTTGFVDLSHPIVNSEFPQHRVQRRCGSHRPQLRLEVLPDMAVSRRGTEKQKRPYGLQMIYLLPNFQLVITHLYTYSFINSSSILTNRSFKHENNLNEVMNKHHSNIYLEIFILQSYLLNLHC